MTGLEFDKIYKKGNDLSEAEFEDWIDKNYPKSEDVYINEKEFIFIFLHVSRLGPAIEFIKWLNERRIWVTH